MVPSEAHAETSCTHTLASAHTRPLPIPIHSRDAAPRGPMMDCSHPSLVASLPIAAWSATTSTTRPSRPSKTPLAVASRSNFLRGEVSGVGVGAGVGLMWRVGCGAPQSQWCTACLGWFSPCCVPCPCRGVRRGPPHRAPRVGHRRHRHRHRCRRRCGGRLAAGFILRVIEGESLMRVS